MLLHACMHAMRGLQFCAERMMIKYDRVMFQRQFQQPRASWRSVVHASRVGMEPARQLHTLMSDPFLFASTFTSYFRL